MQCEYWTLKIKLSEKTGLVTTRKVTEEEIDHQLNEASDNGWELVSAIGLNVGYGQTESVLYTFKRPKS